MPRRNLVIILAVAMLSLAFHAKAKQLRYAGPFSEAVDLIKRRYYRDVDEHALFDSAMSGMIRDLDRNSTFFTAKEYQRFLDDSISMEMEGIGVTLDIQAERLTVLMPLPDGPAFRAGVEAGDVIVKINGKSTENMPTDKARDLIKGPKGTAVKLTIERAGEADEKEIEVTRDTIHLDSVIGESRRADGTWNYFVEGEPRVRYVMLTGFGTTTAEDLRRVINNLQHQPGGIESLVLDLRGNAGGLLESAVEICDLFISKGVIVSIRDRSEMARNEFVASGRNAAGQFPMAVLIDGNSASASEITAACLQDHGRAKIIGTQSFGKGTVQDMLPLGRDGNYLKLTTATYWRPSGRNIHRTDDIAKDKTKWGVLPDEGFEVPLADGDLEAIRRVQLERDRATFGKRNGQRPKSIHAPEPDGPPRRSVEVDPQLRKAVEYLRSQMDAK